MLSIKLTETSYIEYIGIPPIFINFLKIYKQNTSMIINNGFLSPQVSFQRGLTQGCLLSLPLYVIQGQVTTNNINRNTYTEHNGNTYTEPKESGIRLKYPNMRIILISS